MAITPDGKTIYIALAHAVVPISTATDTIGKPIDVSPGGAEKLDRVTADVAGATGDGDAHRRPIE